MNLPIEICGWLSTVLITGHMFPQLVKVIKDGHADGLSSVMLYTWLAGEVLAIPYTIYYRAWAAVVIVTVSAVEAAVFVHYKRR